MQKSSNFPHARQAGLLTTPCQTELLVYDLESDQAHCLNHSAALIWQACDGQTSRADLRQRLLKESQLELDQTELEQCLAQLAERRLLLLASTTPPAATPGATAATNAPIAMPGLTRRAAVRRVGLGAALALPLITSLLVPPAASAGSASNTGTPCTTGAQCTSGICAGNVCQ